MHILNMQFRSCGNMLGHRVAVRRCPVAPRNVARHKQSGFEAMSLPSAGQLLECWQRATRRDVLADIRNSSARSPSHPGACSAQSR